MRESVVKRKEKEKVTKKERNQLETMWGSDIYKVIRKTLKENGYKDISIDEIKIVIEMYSNILYTCLVNGIKVVLPNIGEFYRDIIKGRKAGYYKVPDARDNHTVFDKNMVWKEEYMEKAPDFGKIRFVEFPRVKKRFREETTGKV